MSKKIDFEKLEAGAKKEVQKKEIISDEKLDTALKTIHKTKTEVEKEDTNNKETLTQKSSEIDRAIEAKDSNNIKGKNWTKRNCINVPRELYMRLKTRSLDEDMPMYQYILHCVEQYLDLTEVETSKSHELQIQ